MDLLVIITRSLVTASIQLRQPTRLSTGYQIKSHHCYNIMDFLYEGKFIGDPFCNGRVLVINRYKAYTNTNSTLRDIPLVWPDTGHLVTEFLIRGKLYWP